MCDTFPVLSAANASPRPPEQTRGGLKRETQRAVIDVSSPRVTHSRREGNNVKVKLYIHIQGAQETISPLLLICVFT